MCDERGGRKCLMIYHFGIPSGWCHKRAVSVGGEFRVTGGGSPTSL